jgi:hypothetical protein
MSFLKRIGHYQTWVYEGYISKFNEGIINQDFAINSRKLSFTKTQQR